uniref:Enoyl-CoA hydratase domain-containing protein 3, mitochondrial n=1 Tax=Taeniopygia guttata TaxID=59729 RepID=A0A674GY54_TAEGU
MVSAIFSSLIDSAILRPGSSPRPGPGSGRAAAPGAAELRPPARPGSDGGPAVAAAEAPHGRPQQRRGSRAGPAGGAADGAAAGGGRAVSGGAGGSGGSGTRPRWQLGGSNPAVFHGFCSTIVLNNPRRRNALSLPMLQSLRRDLLHDVQSRELRVIVIAAEGPVFCSGHDLKELSSEDDVKHHSQVFELCAEIPSDSFQFLDFCCSAILMPDPGSLHVNRMARMPMCMSPTMSTVKVMTLIQKLPVPVIAKVNGLATAAGCQLVASCDIAVASEKSQFATPGVNIGLFCSTPAVALGRSLPRKVALEMLFTGEPLSAHEALMHGLVSKVVPEDKLEEETMKISQKICESSKSVLALGKATFYRQITQDLDTAYKITTKVMVDNLTLRDGQEGIEAFVQKRKPVWSHSQEEKK